MKIKFTESALLCLQDIESYKTETMSCSQKAANFIDAFLDSTVEALEHNPERFKVCPQLADYGLHCRERITEDGYRTIFEITNDTVYVLAVLHQRQSIQDALYRLMILH